MIILVLSLISRPSCEVACCLFHSMYIHGILLMDGILWITACSFVSYDSSFNFCLGFLLVITVLQGPWNVTDENLMLFLASDQH